MLGEAVLRSQRLGNRLVDQGRVAQRGEADPEDACLVGRDKRCRRLNGESRLPRPARARQRHQPCAADRVEQLAQLTLPADERARGAREVGVRDRLQRREALRPELEERYPLVEIRETVFAELDQLAVDERPRRCRHDYLAAVTRSGNASGTVKLPPGVALARQLKRASVQPHPYLDLAGRERLLTICCGGERLDWIGEGIQEGVPLRVDLDSMSVNRTVTAPAGRSTRTGPDHPPPKSARPARRCRATRLARVHG